MDRNPAQLFAESGSVDSFRNNMISLEGNFPFEKDDMIALGHEYLKRYPDSFSNRNTEEVQIGYQVVRICIVEIMVRTIDREYRDIFRKLFFNISSINSSVSTLASGHGIESLNNIYSSLSRALNSVQIEIDLLPKGMIKERFIGGITNIYNIMYLLKNAIARCAEQ